VKGPRFLISALLMVLAACAPNAGGSAPKDGKVDRDSGDNRTLVLITRTEPETLAGTPITTLTASTGSKRRLFNAALSLLDGDGRAQPYLAESLPQLGTDDWRVYADGQMDTTYHLRAGLLWHDGQPLTAEDFAFAWRVYATPELGRSHSEPISSMSGVEALDDRTLVVHWLQPYPDAGVLQGVQASGNSGPSFAPLPKHILASAYEQQLDTFATLPFWTVQYVGAGPYRVDRWEPGAFVDGVAFDEHALGRPKIERVQLRFSADSNVVLAAMLAGEAHLPVDDSIRIEGGLVLKQAWAARNAGAIEFLPRDYRFIDFQYRPEYARPKAHLDVRVRQAIARGIDKETINETLFHGVGIPTDTMIYPTADYFPALDAAVTKYAFDPRQTERLMAEAGYGKGQDGFYLDETGSRMTFEITGTQSPQNASERSILADGWRKLGLDTDEAEFAGQEIRDGQRLATFRSMYSTGSSAGIPSLIRLQSDNISGPENRWTRSNRGGWSDPDYDRMATAVQSTLDRAEQGQRVVEALRILTAQAGIISLYFNPTVVVFPATIRGMRIRAPESEPTWNVADWEFAAP